MFRLLVLVSALIAFSVVPGAAQSSGTPTGPAVRLGYALLEGSVGSATAPHDAFPPRGSLVPLADPLGRYNDEMTDLAEPLRTRYGMAVLHTVVTGGVELPYLEERQMIGRPRGFDVKATLLAGNDTGVTLRVRLFRGDAVLAETTCVLLHGTRVAIATREGDDRGFVVFGVEGADVVRAQQAARRPSGLRDLTPPVSPPVKIRDVKPRYPESAQRDRVQGLILIQGAIDPDGVPTDLVIVRSVPGLGEAALEAVRQWRYTPAHDATGKRIQVRTTFTVNFQIAPPRRDP